MCVLAAISGIEHAPAQHQNFLMAVRVRRVRGLPGGQFRHVQFQRNAQMCLAIKHGAPLIWPIRLYRKVLIAKRLRHQHLFAAGFGRLGHG